MALAPLPYMVRKLSMKSGAQARAYVRAKASKAQRLQIELEQATREARLAYAALKEAHPHYAETL